MPHVICIRNTDYLNILIFVMLQIYLKKKLRGNYIKRPTLGGSFLLPWGFLDECSVFCSGNNKQ